MPETRNADAVRTEEWVGLYRERHPEADRWAVGYGAINHTVETQARVFSMAELLAAREVKGDGVSLFDLLHAADRVASAAMWLVAHETYVQNVYLDGRDLRPEDFKPDPQGHTGGALNMVPAYAGYAAANAITGHTRAWIMGQGHCVAAIDSVNLLLDNMTPAHADRYSVSDEGLSRYVRDFYSYRLGEDGKQDSPLGSHVNPHTAGGLAEGGYLGFTELQYVHMPLRGERLVAFLSDGAFEEQRGSDWVPRWWRPEDSGLVTPIMISNGRRIDQRTTMSQQGGSPWFVEHLRLNGFDPFVFDGRDPAAFAWAIIEMENRLQAASEAARSRGDPYPLPLPYGIAVAPKGAGFYGEGTNLAHNLPLGANPHTDRLAAQRFNESARPLWVPLGELKNAIDKFQHHEASGRPRERDHPLALREVRLREVPKPNFRSVPENRLDRSAWTRTSPMYAVDATFLATVQANPHLRPRVGNPDEMRSNRMQGTLDALKFRHHEVSRRPRERDHPLAQRDVRLRQVPSVQLRPVVDDRLDRISSGLPTRGRRCGLACTVARKVASTAYIGDVRVQAERSRRFSGTDRKLGFGTSRSRTSRRARGWSRSRGRPEASWCWNLSMASFSSLRGTHNRRALSLKRCAARRSV